jgi:hypothetical protein
VRREFDPRERTWNTALLGSYLCGFTHAGGRSESG